MTSGPEKKKEQKMWGGRFERGPDASFYEFERSWQFDRRLLPQELALDRAWARAIAAAGIFDCRFEQESRIDRRDSAILFFGFSGINRRSCGASGV